jgi:hypothetical protein
MSAAAAANAANPAVAIPNSSFSADEVSSYIAIFTKRVKDTYLSGANLASKVKFIVNESDQSLVTLYIDGAKELYSMVNTPDMSDHDKNNMVEKLSMMFNVHILDVIASLNSLSSEINLFGWKIESVYPLIRNMFGFGGMNHKTDTPIYGVADFRFVLYLTTHVSADNGVDGLRITPLCNNTVREGTPLRVNVADASEFKTPKRRVRNVDEDSDVKTFVPPILATMEELATPNSAYAKQIAKDIVNHIIGGGSFASRSLKWIEEKTLVGDEKTPRCLTRITYDYSKLVDLAVRKILPAPFFQITQDSAANTTRFPSATAQSLVQKIACQESLRFLANWKTILEETANALQTDAPTIGWRATAVIPMVYNKERFVGKHAEKGGSSATLIIPLTPNLIGAWEGKHPLCSNTAAEGFPMIVDTGRASTGAYSRAARSALPAASATSAASNVASTIASTIASTYTSGAERTARTSRPIATGATGRR